MESVQYRRILSVEDEEQESQYLDQMLAADGSEVHWFSRMIFGPLSTI